MQNFYKTARLVLNPLCSDDADFIIELVNTPGWLRYIGERNVKSHIDSLAYIQKILNNANLDYWVVTIQGENVPIGIITLIKRDYLDRHDIGFAFLTRYAKNGYAFEATKVILYEVQKEQEIINAVTVNDNANSIRLLEKLGFKFEKILEHDGEQLHLYTI